MTFASADTIIPNPANPQSYNRYSYVRNSPLNFSDPTGHRECGVGDDCDGGTNLPQRKPYTRMVSFSGKGWTSEEIDVVIAGANAVANMLYEAGGGQFASAQEAFLAVYGGTVNFYKPGTSSGEGNLGWRENKNSIWVYEHKSATVISEGARWVAHELGHSFDSALHPNTTDDRDYGQGTIDLATSDILSKAIKCYFARRMEFAATSAKTACAVWCPVGEGRLCTCRRGFNRRLKCQIMPFVGI